MQFKRAHTVPQLEASGVSRLLGLNTGDDTRERPADVLLCRAQDVVTGSGGSGASRVALDIGIVCPQAAGHLATAAQERLGAAEEYVRTKCARADTERRCQEAGVWVWLHRLACDLHLNADLFVFPSLAGPGVGKTLREF